MLHSATGPANLLDDIARFRATFEAPVTSAKELQARLRQIYDTLHDIDFGRYDIQNHRAEAPAMMQAIFAAQIALRDRINDWHAAGLMTRPVQKAVRDTLRAARYASDILGEIWIGHARLPEGTDPYPAFTGPHHNTLLAPRFQTGDTSLPFRSGDVILVRGRLHNSAAIARIGDVDSQFSHVAMVYVDPRGEHWAVEALIEDGSVIAPLRDVLRHGLGRAVLFRHRDAALAQRAATIMHDRIRQSRSTMGRPILYDFTMLIDDNSRNLFCSKLVRRAYKEASEGRVLLPTFRTQLNMANRDFPDRIGVRATETFAPGDMELETQFDVVAEWQDYRVTSDLRLQDLVMDKLFEWMETENYRFKETFKIKLISLFGRLSSMLSEDIKEIIEDVVPKVPINMSRSAIAAIAMLHETAQPLLEALRKAETARIATTGLPLHPREVRDELERLKAEMGSQIGYLTKARG
ncbi:MAG: YiiX/YebB-like N1pC/P60 family cysteine hydrolase [Hyphomicrobiaceae bacterium]|nr:YiiX/YebB-like N1pC/P60 family cysteine hydrolase [Hyphomicrobiaceae bacterium]